MPVHVVFARRGRAHCNDITTVRIRRGTGNALVIHTLSEILFGFRRNEAIRLGCDRWSRKETEKQTGCTTHPTGKLCCILPHGDPQEKPTLSLDLLADVFRSA